MRKNYQLIALLLFCFASGRIKSQTAQDFRKIVDTLASATFEGRGYVNDGVVKTADFLAGEFEKCNLQKFKTSYYQNFNIDVNTFPGSMVLQMGEELLIAGKDFLVEPVSPPIKGKFKTVAVKKEELLSEGFVINLLQKSAGKVLVIDERNYKPGDSKTEKQLTETIQFLKYGMQAGNIATIVLTNEKLSWSPAGFQAQKPVFIVNSTISAKNINSVVVSVDAKMRNKYGTSNLVGYTIGTEIPDSFLVVTAHYDHLGRMGSSVYFPGANDNASGVSMILNLAKYFSKNPHKYSVVFLALSAEEVGLLGAKYFTENPLFDLSKIKFLVNFDLTGTGEEGIKVVNATVFPKQFENLKAINDSLQLLPSVQARGEACISDHCMFYQKGVPCFYIYTLGGIKAYHDIYDRPETLPLTEIEDYYNLMIKFFESFLQE